MKTDILIVGAGFSGAVVAERLASHGFDVLVVDKRPHIGGNAYDVQDAHGILIHPYGPHIFHTNGAANRRIPVAVHAMALLRAPSTGESR